MIIVNQRPITVFNFPGGECSVKIDPAIIGADTYITAYLDSSDAIMRLFLTTNAIRHIYPVTNIHLTLPYVAYGRQDRICNIGEAFSIQVMAQLINSLNCQSVTIYDPHSPVTPALINRCKIVSLAEIITFSSLASHIITDDLVLIAPDLGAEKKVRDLAKYLSAASNKFIEVYCATKVRDSATGEILSTNLDAVVFGKNCLIVDDICDGGRTFIELAKVLQRKEADELYLYVTHGIFSQGLETLRTYFNKIYCYHLFGRPRQRDGYLEILGEKHANQSD